MLSNEASCSDCKLEIVQRKWTQLMLNWINVCITPNSEQSVFILNPRNLVDIINRYKDDICANDVDRAMLCTDDLEPFLIFKYPILRLRYFSEDKDIPKKLYVMTSVLLFHCCVSSRDGTVIADICLKMQKHEQEMIVRFCEILGDMEITVNNVESAITEACAGSPQINERYRQKKSNYEQPTKSINNESYIQDSEAAIATNDVVNDNNQSKRYPALKFKSSVTVLPSYITDTSSYSKISLQPASSLSESDSTTSSKSEDMSDIVNVADSNEVTICNIVENSAVSNNENKEKVVEDKLSGLKEPNSDTKPPCKPDCACTRCSVSGPCCGIPGSSVDCDNPMMDKEKNSMRFSWPIYLAVVFVLLVIIAITVGTGYAYFRTKQDSKQDLIKDSMQLVEKSSFDQEWAWDCKEGVCRKIFQPNPNISVLYTSLSRCILICMGPQVWPQPIGYTSYSKSLVSVSTDKLEYKMKSIPSDVVHQYLAEAFKLFLGDLARLERSDAKRKSRSLTAKKLNIQIDVESDSDPRLRLNTDESYQIRIDTTSTQVKIVVNSASFCGVRHGLETLSQLILLDESTGCLIILSSVVIKDAPSYKYRGLMIDTGRNYIPVPDIMRTVDAMATCKLNTFHWRISDATSFPLLLPNLPKLFEYGAYDRSMVYTKEDVKSIVKRAGIRGIRVLIEVAMPGPVGRAWSWSDDATCARKGDNNTCDNILCVRLKMQGSMFDTLQYIYSQILEMTAVDDIFHLSDSIFSLSNCYDLHENRDGFLEKALDRLRLANKGFLPKLPIIWYNSHLKTNSEDKVWERMGVQLTEWQPGEWDQNLNQYRVIHSTRWDLSCEMKKQRCFKYRTWQEMYSWNTWRTIEVHSIVGGEAILWTDLVDSGNLDYHLWPRAAAVAERLWSDMVANTTPSGRVYARLDRHRWRMLLRGVKVQPVWPLWCSLNPSPCLDKIHR